MVAEGSVQIIWTIYFLTISKNAMTFLFFCAGLNAVTFLLCLFITESPRYLYGVQKFEECSKALETIARRNGVKDYQTRTFEVEYDVLLEDLNGLGDSAETTRES